MASFKFTYLYEEILDAYHGTHLRTANKILREQKFEIGQRNEDLFLGDGIYFYEGSLYRAKWWAQKKYRNQGIGVLRARIELGIFLNLNDPNHQDVLIAGRVPIEKRIGRNCTTTAILNLFAAIHRIDTIRASIPINPRPELSDFMIWKMRRFSAKNPEIILCVKTPERVLDIRMEYRGIPGR